MLVLRLLSGVAGNLVKLNEFVDFRQVIRYEFLSSHAAKNNISRIGHGRGCDVPDRARARWPDRRISLEDVKRGWLRRTIINFDAR